jgi:hypothetical protein
MSKFYAEKNTESTALLFNKRLYYKRASRSRIYTNLIDFIAEKMMYGRVSRRFVPIVVPKTSKNLKSVKGSAGSERNMQALNFVADAFSDLEQQFRKAAITKKIDTTDQYLTNLKIYKAYEDPRIRYQRYMEQLRAPLRAQLAADPNKIENFDDFTEFLINFSEINKGSTPFTFPAYVKSRRCPITVSGLAIEIADLDASNDDGKAQAFIDSNNWEFFVNAAATYGFMVDKNVPWRLVADIGSSPMIQYATRHRFFSTDEVLLFAYQKVHSSYYTTFKTRLLSMYNFVKPRIIQYTEECGGRTIMREKKPKNYQSVSYLKSIYPESYFIRLYCKMRFEEEESEFTENERRLLVDDVLEITASQNVHKAINQFEIILNKTFDYQGSLGYYNRKRIAIEAATE